MAGAAVAGGRVGGVVAGGAVVGGMVVGGMVVVVVVEVLVDVVVEVVEGLVIEGAIVVGTEVRSRALPSTIVGEFVFGLPERRAPTRTTPATGAVTSAPTRSNFDRDLVGSATAGQPDAVAAVTSETGAYEG